ncbi:TPA: hypothetical protein N0F65_011727 [Lagenidium giganteum]|uniref:Amine oxidase domain-containing protein n=1 Tax=Lagenidium giganteum TaxID=4803 RepID=A0AAV2YF38_9STRA|nr:TPA: hypothetical protein N0F65_011727 [Lagenidium giganteum]
MGKTLIVGAGITGAVTAHLLQEAKRASRIASDVIVWEKNNIVGGRMMARSFRKNRQVHVDMGAQYLTRFTHTNDDIRELLVQANKLAPFDDSRILPDAKRLHESSAIKDHTVSPDSHGLRSIVEYLLKDTPTRLSKEVDRYEILNKNEIKVIATDGDEVVVNDLVFTCPIPAVLPILRASDYDKARIEENTSLSDVKYSKRFAIAFLFDKSIAAQVKQLGWTAKYVSADEDSIIRYLCWDNLKKDATSEDHFTLLVHTGVPFGEQYIDRKDQDEEVLATVRASLKKLLPFLPSEEDTIVHRWRYPTRCSENRRTCKSTKALVIRRHSQVVKPHDDPLVPSLVLNSSLNIYLAGDAFLGSTFDKCLLSAKSVVEMLSQRHGASSL